MNIFKTFEIFLREPLSILKDKFVQIVNIQTPDARGKGSLSAELLNNKAQITVYNSEKMYNLLQTVMYKKKLQEEQRYIAPPKEKVVVGQLFKRQYSNS